MYLNRPQCGFERNLGKCTCNLTFLNDTSNLEAIVLVFFKFHDKK